MLISSAAWAVARRVPRELFRDPRSRVILVVTPSVLLIVVRGLFHSSEAFSRTGALMIGVIPALMMYLLGSAAIVHERTNGTLETVLTTPARKIDVIIGYELAASVVSVAQAVVTTVIAYWVDDLHTASPPWLFGVLALAGGIWGMSVGLLISAVCNNEGEVFQILLAVMIPQMLVSGMVWPVARMTGWVRRLEGFLPLSSVTRTMSAARLHDYGGAPMARSMAVMAAITLGSIVLAAAVLARRAPTD